jgi:hypothetical protein
MSKLKSPQEKKAASLVNDGRNVYGENDKASRKLIPKGKQLSHQAFRRQARQPLASLSTSLPEDQIVAAESAAIESEVRNRRKAFKKEPDLPLGHILASKKTPYLPPWFGGEPYRSTEEILTLEKRKRRS